MKKSLDFYTKNIQSLSFSGVSTDEQETVIVFSRNNDTASVETTAIIPGATLKLAYGAADNDMNFLKDQIALQPAQNLGKVDATCTIKF